MRIVNTNTKEAIVSMPRVGTWTLIRFFSNLNPADSNWVHYNEKDGFMYDIDPENLDSFKNKMAYDDWKITVVLRDPWQRYVSGVCEVLFGGSATGFRLDVFRAALSWSITSTPLTAASGPWAMPAPWRPSPPSRRDCFPITAQAGAPAGRSATAMTWWRCATPLRTAARCTPPAAAVSASRRLPTRWLARSAAATCTPPRDRPGCRL